MSKPEDIRPSAPPPPAGPAQPDGTAPMQEMSAAEADPTLEWSLGEYMFDQNMGPDGAPIPMSSVPQPGMAPARTPGPVAPQTQPAPVPEPAPFPSMRSFPSATPAAATGTGAAPAGAMAMPAAMPQEVVWGGSEPIVDIAADLDEADADGLDGVTPRLEPFLPSVTPPLEPFSPSVTPPPVSTAPVAPAPEPYADLGSAPLELVEEINSAPLASESELVAVEEELEIVDGGSSGPISHAAAPVPSVPTIRSTVRNPPPPPPHSPPPVPVIIPAATPTAYGSEDVTPPQAILSAAAGHAAPENDATRPLPPIVLPPEVGGVGATPHSTPWPEALSQRPRKKRLKPWFEEVFDEDYLRTLPFMTAEQTLREVGFINDALAPPAEGEILDVACGYGRHAIELSQRGLKVTGLDLSLPLLIRAADESQRRALSVNYVHADMREMTFDGQFDGAYCMLSSFGYFDEETNLKVATSICRALKPGRRFLLDVVNRDYIVGDLPTRVWWEGDGCVVLEEVDFNFHTSRLVIRRSVVFQDGRQVEQDISIRAYSLHELGKLMRQAGFRVLDVSGSMATKGTFFGATSRNIVLVCERPAA